MRAFMVLLRSEISLALGAKSLPEFTGIAAGFH
jgi:hypothetical protein